MWIIVTILIFGGAALSLATKSLAPGVLCSIIALCVVLFQIVGGKK